MVKNKKNLKKIDMHTSQCLFYTHTHTHTLIICHLLLGVTWWKPCQGAFMETLLSIGR